MVYSTFSCGKAGALMDPERKKEFAEDVAEEYEELREDHYDSLKVCSLQT